MMRGTQCVVCECEKLFVCDAWSHGVVCRVGVSDGSEHDGSERLRIVTNEVT